MNKTNQLWVLSEIDIMNEQGCRTSQLVVWYREFLENGRSAAFVSCVATRYSLPTLGRMTRSLDVEIRRAAVLAIGMLGGEESIAAVGASLRDSDRCVRLVAEIAFADLTRREMGVVAGQRLDSIRRHVDGHRYAKAAEMLDELSEAWPNFADALHLRAVVGYCIGQYQPAAKWAQRASQLNRYHFAAITLEARCWLELDSPQRALSCFEKSYAINPSQATVGGFVDVLKRNARRMNLDDSF